MNLITAILGLCLGLVAWAGPVTVSGLSSGGFFAHQFHLANSSWVSGAAVLAGGPFYCAQGQLEAAFYRCMETRDGEPTVAESMAEAREQARARRIDPLHHVARSRVFVMSGSRDRTVVHAVVQSLVDFYRALGVPAQNITFDDSLEVGHAFPTADFGNPCGETSRPPYISNCGRDVAGEILTALAGARRSPLVPRAERLFRFNQALAMGLPRPDAVSMHATGFVYIPEACERDLSRCPLHVAFHGCRQTQDDIGDAFVTRTGYNPWAEANGVVVLYPQAAKSYFAGNPRGCWDWWGYTGPLFHTRAGPQMAAVTRMVRTFTSGAARLLPLIQE